ncbi:hypothetical protein PF008_g14901 [Phytophthora fragariae]|uniref:Uncharacterized protein n=1 Tax=Phytophthora fragariae TaxID=53985 RepID=A0A6G0RG71_9STRA|nr:hypothetical protein PF008_g14901 [Phytophthora fragariae]
MLCCISFCISHPTLARSPFGQIPPPPHTHTTSPRGKIPVSPQFRMPLGLADASSFSKTHWGCRSNAKRRRL